MNVSRSVIGVLVVAMVAASGGVHAQTPLGTAFTYQGQLLDDGRPVNDTCNFQFECYDAASGGTQIGGTVGTNGVGVVNGLFTVTVDFGSGVFGGEARWLETSVQCSGGGGFTTLSPRQELTPAPYALYAARAASPDGHSLDAADGDPTDALCVDNDGHVGIGTPTPAQRLEVNGTAQMTGFKMSTGAANGRVLTSDASGVGTWQPASGGVGGSGTAGYLPKFESATSIGDSVIYESGTGRIGIGNTDPAVKLDVSGSVQATAAVIAPRFSDVDNPNYFVDPDDADVAATLKGKVGIGTASPIDVNLHINAGMDVGKIAVGGTREENGEDIGLMMFVAHNDYYIPPDMAFAGIGGRIISNTTMDFTGALLFYTANPGIFNKFSEKMRISPNGNVGIGTESPGEKLTVDGMIESTQNGFKFPDGSVQVTAAGGAVAAWSLTGNSGTDVTVNFVGTVDDEPLELRVNDERVFRFEPDAISPNLIGGHYENSTTNGAYGATIGGGGEYDHPNCVTAEYGTIGGGRGNTAGWSGTVGGGDFNTSGTNAVVGGGISNAAYENGTIGGGYQNVATNGYSTVGGGVQNTAKGGSATIGGGGQNVTSNGYATIAGGHENAVVGYGATVGGGELNEAGGDDATVPGGYWNSADGDYSFAAGYRATANSNGTFVWADHNLYEFPSPTESNFTPDSDQFLVRATGGVVLVTAIDGAGNSTAGVELPAGASEWYTLSDRDAKADLRPVDPRDVLERLGEVPISTWSYKAQSPAIRHMGPMAQDMYATFGLGQSDRRIGTADADGVALAAIQGLYEIVKEKDAEIAALRARLDRIEALMNDPPSAEKGGAE